MNTSPIWPPNINPAKLTFGKSPIFEVIINMFGDKTNCKEIKQFVSKKLQNSPKLKGTALAP